jgi:hypothetical protein
MGIQRNIHMAGRMVPVDLNILKVKGMLLQQVLDATAGRIISDSRDQTYRPSHLFQMEGKVERRTADAFILRELIDQYFTDDENHRGLSFIEKFKSNLCLSGRETD